MAQAGSNDEKNWSSKISLDCPFKVHIRFLITKFYSASIYKFFSSFVNFAGFASTHPDRDEALFLSNSLGEKFNFFILI